MLGRWEDATGHEFAQLTVLYQLSHHGQGVLQDSKIVEHGLLSRRVGPFWSVDDQPNNAFQIDMADSRKVTATTSNPFQCIRFERQNGALKVQWGLYKERLLLVNLLASQGPPQALDTGPA